MNLNQYFLSCLEDPDLEVTIYRHMNGFLNVVISTPSPDPVDQNSPYRVTTEINCSVKSLSVDTLKAFQTAIQKTLVFESIKAITQKEPEIPPTLTNSK